MSHPNPQPPPNQTLLPKPPALLKPPPPPTQSPSPTPKPPFPKTPSHPPKPPLLTSLAHKMPPSDLLLLGHRTRGCIGHSFLLLRGMCSTTRDSLAHSGGCCACAAFFVQPLTPAICDDNVHFPLGFAKIYLNVVDESICPSRAGVFLPSEPQAAEPELCVCQHVLDQTRARSSSSSALVSAHEP